MGTSWIHVLDTCYGFYDPGYMLRLFLPAHVQLRTSNQLDVQSDHRAGVKAVTIKSGVSGLPVTFPSPPSDVETTRLRHCP